MSGRIFPYTDDSGRFKWLPESDPGAVSTAVWKAWRDTLPPLKGSSLMCQSCGQQINWFDAAPGRRRDSGWGKSKGAYIYTPGGRISISCLVKFMQLVRTGEYEGCPLDVFREKVERVSVQVQGCVGCQHRALTGPIDRTWKVLKWQAALRAATNGTNRANGGFDRPQSSGPEQGVRRV